MKPVWLLDIDGVINAYTAKPDRNVWPGDTWREAKINGFNILVATPVIDFINEVHESGRADIRWHTTWQDDAQLVADEFGLPKLPIAEAPEYTERLKGRIMNDETWWKLGAVERVLPDEERPLIWTDDDITWSVSRREQDRIRALHQVLMISPDSMTGLTRRNLRRINEFLIMHEPN